MKERAKEKNSFRGNSFCKILEMILLVVSILALCACALEDYIVNTEKPFETAILNQAKKDYAYINNCYQETKGQKAEGYCASRNISYQIICRDGSGVLADTYDGYHTRYQLVIEDVRIGYKKYDYYLYINDNFPFYDEYREIYDDYMEKYGNRFFETGDYATFFVIGCFAFFTALICFFLLLYSAGYRKGREEISHGFMAPVYFDVLTLIMCITASAGVRLTVRVTDHIRNEYALLFVMAMAISAAVVLGMLYLMEFVIRLKRGKWWRHTLIYVVLRFVWCSVKRVLCFMAGIMRGIPMVPATVLFYIAIAAAELFGIRIMNCRDGVYVLWFAEKVILFLCVVYCAQLCKKLQNAGEALASGNLNFKLDTSKMFLDFKKHGESLNRIGEGITGAVEERMKSERLKTELITNVSHDLKTPLTSIINYADLLGNEGVEPEKVSEYAEVLLRQSKRLKKLLDDLIDASKASTGNLEVNLEKCEIGVMLTQAAGEYEKRFAERNLTLIDRQPEKAVYIMADGRHLWRIFDNLLNNVCKYAQENSRVYLTLEEQEGKAVVIFRNMSRYPLEISGEELQERFVRGDKSRNMEGNGLGLSIAGSLAGLQKASMEVITDGDLFKVILKFPKVAD